jgi:predicted Zn-ribbon and HTH transcriptional regulator
MVVISSDALAAGNNKNNNWACALGLGLVQRAINSAAQEAEQERAIADKAKAADQYDYYSNPQRQGYHMLAWGAMCSQCGHVFKLSKNLIDSNCSVVCPNCRSSCNAVSAHTLYLQATQAKTNQIASQFMASSNQIIAQNMAAQNQIMGMAMQQSQQMAAQTNTQIGQMTQNFMNNSSLTNNPLSNRIRAVPQYNFTPVRSTVQTIPTANQWSQSHPGFGQQYNFPTHQSGNITRSGNTIYDSNGTSYTISGNTLYGSNGTTFTRSGNAIYSNGIRYTQSGNQLCGSDGSVINFSGGVSGNAVNYDVYE